MDHSMSEEQALELVESGWWKHATTREICLFQLSQERLCMPFGALREAVSKELGQEVTDSAFMPNMVKPLLISILKKK